MDCPYCGKEMAKGFLGSMEKTGGWMYWLEQSYFMQHTFLPVTKKKMKEAGGYVIPHDGSGLAGIPNTFYVCRACGKLIGDVEK
ncbi:MAG TPA: hypothetical protein DCG49_05040 [Ruminococcus sp.]|nr:hypothetical protein [Ruminococcus sp.]